MIIPSFYSLAQCDRIVVENNTMPLVKSYYSCLNRLLGEGYSEDFQFTKQGIQSKASQKEYSNDEFKILNMFRFEGSGNNDDNVLMYMLETSDGRKGTLIISPNDGTGLFSKVIN